MSLTKKKEFNIFINKCLPEIDNYQSFNIPSTIKRQAEDITLAHLTLPSMGQVRDRFEGQKYYDRIYRKLIVLHCLEKMLNKTVISVSMIKAKKSVNLNSIHVNGKYVAIVDFIFGDLPLIDSTSSLDTLVFCIRDGYKAAYFCGSLPKKELGIKSNFMSTDSLSSKNHRALFTFTKFQ